MNAENQNIPTETEATEASESQSSLKPQPTDSISAGLDQEIAAIKAQMEARRRAFSQLRPI
jgi:hypothetical protein